MTQATNAAAEQPALAVSIKQKLGTLIAWLTAAIVVISQIIEVIELVKIERATSLIDRDTTVLVEKARIQLQNQLLAKPLAPNPSSTPNQ